MKKVMGVGTVYLTISTIVVLISNYAIHVGLARYLGPEKYGIFGVVMSIFLIFGALLSNGLPKALSKLVAGSKEKKKVMKSSISLQLMLAAAISLTLVIFSKQFSFFLKDVSFTRYIILIGIMILPFGYYSLYLRGFLNGLRMFKAQAIIVIVQQITRVIATFVLVAVGLSVMGALWGYFIAITVGSICCIYILKNKISNRVDSSVQRNIIKLGTPLIIIALGITLIRNINTLFLKAMQVDATSIGYYTAAVALSNVIYLFFSALPLTLLPSIAKSVAENNLALTQKYISLSLRYLLLILLPITSLIIGTSKEIIELLYSSAYVSGAPALQILALSSMGLVIFMALGAVLIAGGYSRIKMNIILIMIPILIIFNYFLIPKYQILGAAIASFIVSFLAMLIGGVIVYQKFGRLVKLKSFFRITLSALTIYIITSYWHYSGLYLFINYILMCILYLFLLIMSKELKKEDFLMMLNLIRNK